MKNIKYFITIVAIIIVSSAAQAKSKKFKVLYRPFKYNLPFRAMDKSPVIDEEGISGNPWRVYSCQENCTTYNKPERNSKRLKTTFFMQQFFAVEDRGDWIHIVYDTKFNNKTDRFSAKAIDYGWIEKEKLLLSPMSLVNNSISRFPLLIVTINSINSLNNNLPWDLVKIYNSPELQSISYKTEPIFGWYYVYKETSKSYLIGKTTYFSEYGKQNSIIGWVSKDKAELWDNRLAYNLNRNLNALEERKAKNIRGVVLADRISAGRYGNQSVSERNMILIEADDFPNNNPFLRLKYEGGEGGIIQVSTTGCLQTKPSILPDTKKKVLQDSLSDLNKMKKINIVYVVDLTNGKKEYYNYLVKGINLSLKRLNNISYNIPLTYGLLTYKNTKHGYRVIKKVILNKETDNVDDFFNDTFYDSRKIKRNNPEGAMLSVFYEAIHHMNLDSNSMNQIIYITSELQNDSKKQNKTSLIIKKNVEHFMRKMNCQLTAFQFANSYSNGSFDSFTESINNFMFAFNTEVNNKRKGPFLENDSLNIDGNLIPRIFIKNGLLRSELYYSVQKKFLTEKEIADLISLSITNFYREVKRRAYRLNILLNINTVPFFNTKAFVNERGGVYASSLFTTTGCKSACNWSAPFTLKGYISKNHIGLENPVFIPFILLSEQELRKLQLDMKELMLSYNRDNGRSILLGKWNNLLKEIQGSATHINTHTISWGKMISIIYSLPEEECHGGVLSNYRIQDVKTQIKNKEIDEFYIHLKSSINKIESILNNADNKLSFKVNNTVYYWLNISYLP